MAQKERQQSNQLGQEEFAPKSCYIITKEHLIYITYNSKDWQSVTVYKMEDGKQDYLSHLTFSIDVNKEKKSCLIDYNKIQDKPEDFLKEMVFIEYIYSIVYDAMKWMEFWKEDNLDDAQRAVREF